MSSNQSATSKQIPSLTSPQMRWRRWIIGARPRTLPAAIVPVVVGTAVAAASVDVIWWRFLATMIVGLGMQVAVNYANDYSDGIKGTDDKRVGPLRLVASGLASPRLVRTAAFAAFLVASIAGLALAAATSWWLVAVGVGCILAAWLYTGGPKPYGYFGLGEVSVFLFFGLTAVCGTQYVQQEEIDIIGVLAASAVGLLAMAMLVVNNLRDIPTDTIAGKKTLAVRLGDKQTRHLYSVCVFSPFGVALLIAVLHPWVLLSLLAIPLAIAANRPILKGATGRDLIAVLQATGKLQLAYGAMFALGLII